MTLEARMPKGTTLAELRAAQAAMERQAESENLKRRYDFYRSHLPEKFGSLPIAVQGEVLAKIDRQVSPMLESAQKERADARANAIRELKLDFANDFGLIVVGSPIIGIASAIITGFATGSFGYGILGGAIGTVAGVPFLLFVGNASGAAFGDSLYYGFGDFVYDLKVLWNFATLKYLRNPLHQFREKLADAFDGALRILSMQSNGDSRSAGKLDAAERAQRILSALLELHAGEWRIVSENEDGKSCIRTWNPRIGLFEEAQQKLLGNPTMQMGRLQIGRAGGLEISGPVEDMRPILNELFKLQRVLAED